MRRQRPKEITELDLERARWHVDHGTRQFRDFLRTGEHDFTVTFARWLRENKVGTVARP